MTERVRASGRRGPRRAWLLPHVGQAAAQRLAVRWAACGRIGQLKSASLLRDHWAAVDDRGVGPAGAYVASLDVDQAARLRERCRTLLPSAPFVLVARAWAARGLV